MGIMIRKVELKDAGPIQNFSHDFTPLTLVYGHNETGKTTILDNMLRVLFFRKKDRSRGGVNRGEDFEGKMKITLATATGDLLLKEGTTGLDAILPDSADSLPADLHRLLYVRASDASLETGGEGLSRGLVKALVSDQQIFERIKKNLPNEVGYTEFSEGQLTGKRTGRYKDLVQARERLQALDDLTNDFYKTLSRTRIVTLRKEETLVRQTLKKLESAKRYQASALAKKIVREEKLRDKIDTKALAKLDRLVDDHQSLTMQVNELAKKGKQHHAAESDLAWLRSAKTSWLEFSLQGHVSSSSWLFYLSGLCLVISIFTMGQSRLAGTIFAALALVGLVVKHGLDRMANKTLGQSAELEKISTECQERFSFKPKTSADFDVHEDVLRDEAALQKRIKLEEDAINQKLALCAHELQSAFPSLAIKSIKSEIQNLVNNWERHDQACRKYENELARLDVDEHDFLDEDPGIPYSNNQVSEYEARLDEIENEIENEESALETVHAVALGLLQEKLPSDLGQASETLDKARKEQASLVRDLYAKLAAAKLVEAVLEGFMGEEDKRVEAWLADAGVCDLVQTVTGRYNRLSFLGDELMVANETESFPLSTLSSGAVEQVLLGIRMGIAPAVTGQTSLFMLLDDAFQFSDWNRRSMLVEALGRMLKAGWQVVYFTMDDDIRGRINSLGKKLGKNQFSEIVLEN